MNRRERRQAARGARKADRAPLTRTVAGESRLESGRPAALPSAPASAPASALTRKQLAFAVAWAEAEPDEPLYEIAQRAGYSESVSKGGKIAELCRHPEVVRLRDRRLADLAAVSGVTPEDALVSLQRIAADGLAPAKDRVAANKVILAWYARDKGQHRPSPAGSGVGEPLTSPTPRARGYDEEDRRAFEADLLGVTLDEEDPA